MTVILENEDLTLWTNESEGFVFIHMDVRNWTLSSYKLLKKSVSNIRKQYSNKGHELIFATTEDENITKMWDRLHPLDDLRTFGNGKTYWIGSWETEDY